MRLLGLDSEVGYVAVEDSDPPLVPARHVGREDAVPRQLAHAYSVSYLDILKEPPRVTLD